jgi:hypothetical protein
MHEYIHSTLAAPLRAAARRSRARGSCQPSAISHQLNRQLRTPRCAKGSDSNSAGIAIVRASRSEFESDPARAEFESDPARAEFESDPAARNSNLTPPHPATSPSIQPPAPAPFVVFLFPFPGSRFV